MSGIDVMKEIKDVEPSVLVIIVAAYGDEEAAVKAFRGGARDYLEKPFSISELFTKIGFRPRPQTRGSTAQKEHPSRVRPDRLR
jgi:DNA-binding response OmpR family regulator